MFLFPTLGCRDWILTEFCGLAPRVGRRRTFWNHGGSARFVVWSVDTLGHGRHLFRIPERGVPMARFFEAISICGAHFLPFRDSPILTRAPRIRSRAKFHLFPLTYRPLRQRFWLEFFHLALYSLNYSSFFLYVNQSYLWAMPLIFCRKL